MKLFPTILCCALLLVSCQKLLLEEEEGGQGNSVGTFPQGTGAGTEQFPFSVRDVMDGRAQAADGTVWVIGYAVGAAYRTLSTADFSPSVPYATNLLLSADSLCTDVARCIPVELSSSKSKAQFALPNNPSGYRQCVMLEGIPQTYYKENGLRKVSAGRWLYGFDLSNVSGDPQEWEVDSIFW